MTIILCTCNRGELLQDAMRTLLAQREATPPFEVIVVDNNSTDATKEVIERFARSDGRVRYVFEPRQGLSYARNAGVLAARAPVVAFTDDDVRADRDWVAALLRAFDEHPQAHAVGGRVLPLWPNTPPAWLTRDHWPPLALVDHGDVPIEVSPERPICLVGANLAFRRGVFDTVGLFAPNLQRVGNGIGSLEDHEYLLRLLRAGHRAVYEPRIVVRAEIQPERMARRYHRQWHAGHGHFHALLRSEVMERTTVGTWHGVPAHLYRQAAGDIFGWLGATAAGDRARAFRHEVRLHFFWGFFRTRRREFSTTPRHDRNGRRALARAKQAGVVHRNG